MDQYLIWNHERGMWWKPSACGYTDDITQAGKYGFYEALEIIEDAHHGRIWPQETLLPLSAGIKARIIEQQQERD